MKNAMRAVFDTNVLLSAALWEGSVAQKLLFKLIRSDVEICSSLEIIAEFDKVLRRDFDYSSEEASTIVEKMLIFLVLVNPTKRLNAVLVDPDDNKIIECAVASSAKFVISYDPHLLNLIEYSGIKIISPPQAMKILV